MAAVHATGQSRHGFGPWGCHVVVPDDTRPPWMQGGLWPGEWRTDQAFYLLSFKVTFLCDIMFILGSPEACGLLNLKFLTSLTVSKMGLTSHVAFRSN